MNTAATFELEITFTGMFLFVPHGDHLHVLLPSTVGGMKHTACLSDGKKECDLELKERGDLRIESLAGTSGHNQPPASAFDISRITNKRIQKRQLEGEPSKDVFLRLTLPFASHPLSRGKLSEWKLEGISPNPLLSNQVIWTRRGVTLSPLTVARRNFKTGNIEETFDFQPTGSKVNLYFDYLPEREDTPYFGYVAHHFGHYFDLYNPREPKKLPKLAQHPIPEPEKMGGQEKRRAASTFTCMTAQAPAG